MHHQKPASAALFERVRHSPITSVLRHVRCSRCRGHTPFIVAIETSDDGRPRHARLQVVRGFRASCSGVEAGTTVVSDGGQWFRCIAEQPGIIHERHITGSDRRSARHPLGEHGAG